jgi:uncharacterized membrane protein YdbT with pleckstrin-like domain
MSGSTQKSGQELWRGRPWILPYAAVRTFLVAVIAAGVLFLENSMNILFTLQYGLPIIVWTLAVFFIIWILGIFNLLILRFTHLYILRNDSLEIKSGLLTSKTSMIVPTGFSDLEMIRSVSNRILGTGDITIKIQSEKDFTKRMVKVKDPKRVADLIRNVMARPIFRVDEDSSGKNN